jgi:arylsulfatase A-like enzyme
MVLNLDVAPTFLELAGVTVPREMQGRSWVPLVAGQAAGWRASFFYEYFLEAAYPTTPTVFAVRTTKAKLIKYPGRDDWTELFDLENDPYETKNLARDPAHQPLLTALQAEFARQQAAVAFRVPEHAGKPAPAAR